MLEHCGSNTCLPPIFLQSNDQTQFSYFLLDTAHSSLHLCWSNERCIGTCLIWIVLAEIQRGYASMQATSSAPGPLLKVPAQSHAVATALIDTVKGGKVLIAGETWARTTSTPCNVLTLV